MNYFYFKIILGSMYQENGVKNNMKRRFITKDIEKRILILRNEEKKSVREIAKELGISIGAVSKVYAKYRVPKKKNKNLIELVSLRLLYFCDDIKLLTKRIACEIINQDIEEIKITLRTKKIVGDDKIVKIVDYIKHTYLKVNFN